MKKKPLGSIVAGSLVVRL
ncbi:unnamed protein product [Lathyrus oleraceus]